MRCGAGSRQESPSRSGGALSELLATAVLCNGASLRQSDGLWSVVGDPTEGALLVAAAGAGWHKEALEREVHLRGRVSVRFGTDDDRRAAL
ncbi:MAG: hypothetical protein U0231_03470 [Nitrospiraceae bacterium]